MGKKTKIGKSRQDKFYKLAKETGYRSRAAFKLLQLNREFQFLEKSRVCVDLCAAPGGWLQVASQVMPVSKIILGVDLFPIRPVLGCTTYIADITTDQCKKILRKELQTWKADVVLHDGAPNVGTNWLHDAFTQVQLTLSALKLATELLRRGGWFVTKVFRSKDYHSLLWVLNQLFYKVHSTKPQASRNESAEIFVVCQGYRAPDQLDPKFLDPKYVFKEVETILNSGINMFHPEKDRRKAEGYADNDYTLHHKLPVSEFFSSGNYTEKMADSHEIVLDDEVIANHALTTNEIKECCRDLRVLGKTDLKALLTWRKKVRKDLAGKVDQGPEEMEVVASEGEEVEEEIAKLEEERKMDVKRKKRRILKEKRKLREKMSLNMIIPGDTIEQTERELFSLNRVKTIESSALSDEDLSSDDDDDDDKDDNGWMGSINTKTNTAINVDETDSKTQLWFSKPAFVEFSDDEEEVAKKDTPAADQPEPGKRKYESDDEDEDTEEEEDDDEEIRDIVKKATGQGPVKKLDPLGLAIGEEMIKSKKRRREIIESSYHKFTYGDEDLPEWFVEDETKHTKIITPVTKEQINSYRPLNINTRTIKKVAEAKARKKRRMAKRMEKARKKAEVVGDTEMGQKEKVRQMKDIYKKAGLLKAPKREVTYVVTKKGLSGKKPVRPPGVKGFYKVVDPRMRKDKLKEKKSAGKKPKKTAAKKSGKKSRKGKKK